MDGLEFHERLTIARKRKGLTQERLAKLMNIAQPNLSRYENGDSTPSIEVLKKFAEHLGVSSDYLLFGEA